jgi:hypothetical protein
MPGHQKEGINAVLETLQSTEDPRKREEFLNSVFRKASTMGVATVLEWVRQLPKADRDSALLALHSEWSGDSVARLTTRLFARPIAFALGAYLLNHQLASPEQPAAFANEFLSGNARADLLTQAAAQLAATDPGRAYDFGEGLAGRQQAGFFSGFLSAWTAKDPQAAWQWVNQVAESSKRMELQANFIIAESKTDPSTAARELSLLEPGSATRSMAVRGLAATWAGKDTAATLLWADALPSETDREAAKEGIAASAPVGIGVALYIGDGVAVVQDTYPGGPAERSGAFRQGDRIIAATDAAGAWVDLTGLPLEEVVEHLRGEPGTSIQLQLQSPNQNTTRTVSIAREQIVRRAL